MKKVDPVRSTSRRVRRASASWQRALLLLILLAAAFLRFYRLDAQSLWYDEGVTAQVAAQGIAELTRWTAGDIQPPLYYYLIWGFSRLAGHSEWALRLPSAFFSILLVPLFYLLGKRLFGVRSALVAVVLAALSPLYVYYGQEARMYTMLTALSMAAALLLLAVLDSTRRRSRWWLWTGLAVVCIAALYTHYFAGFLLLALAVYVLLEHLRDRTVLLEGVVTAAVVAVSYAPWLPAMVSRFRDDASYWSGSLKLHEALRHLLISFSMGETVLEEQAVSLMWVFAALLLLSVLSLTTLQVGSARKPRDIAASSPLLFLLLYLLVPGLCVLLLSCSNPKFNPRYLMLVSPAFLLLIGSGIANCWGRYRDCARSRPLGIGLGASSVAGMAFILAVSGYSIWNWFVDEAFTKAQFREVARYVADHAEVDETVTLTSGHMSPVWDYYAPQTERHRIPDIDILDVNATLGYHTADELNAVLANKGGVWTVLWQNDVVDPNGFLSELLRTVGDEQPVDAGFWHVGLRHYRLPSGADIPGAPDVQHLVNGDFAGQVQLLGWSQNSSDSITLYWQALVPTDRDLKVALVLEDQQGIEWGRMDRRPAAYGYPTFRWHTGETIFAHMEIPAIPGTPPDSDYRLRVSLYDEITGDVLDVLDFANNPLGTSVYLDGIVIPRVAAGDPLEHLLARRGASATEIVLGSELRLRGYVFDASPMRVGEKRALATVWEAITLQPSLDLQFRLVDETGGVVMNAGLLNLPDEWHEGQLLLAQDYVTVPGTVTSKRLSLELVAARQGHHLGEPIGLLEFPVVVPDRSWSPPAMDLEIGAELEGRVVLLGIIADRREYSPGETLSVTAIWQPSIDLSEWDLTGFVHLLDEGGRSIAQDDHIPVRGERPTSGWLQGEIIVDRYDLLIPVDASAGDYSAELGLYENDGTRWLVSDPETGRGDNSVVLKTVTIR